MAALALLAGGFLLGLVIWFVGQSRRRVAVAAAVILLVAASVAVVPTAAVALRDRRRIGGEDACRTRVYGRSRL